MIKYLYYFLISLVLVFIAQSIFPALNLFSNVNLLLVVLVFITIVFGFNLGFIFAVLIGFFINIYSYLPLGTLIVVYLLTLLIVNFLYKNVLINFSFYTNLILILVATFFYTLMIYLFNLLFYFLGFVNLYINLDKIFLVNFGWQIFSNLILMMIFYFIARFTIKKLNLAFLVKK